MDIDPRRLRFLLAVARTGGVLAAADELSVTASAVSQQLARLEAETGLALVRRSAGGTELTAAGTTLAETAEEVERLLNQARADLMRAEGDVAGTVRLGAFESFIAAVVGPHLGEWRQRHPNLGIDVIDMPSTEESVRRLRSGDLDAVVIEYDASDEPRPLGRGFAAVPLLDEPWKLLMPAGPASSGDVVDPRRLAVPWLTPDPSAANAKALRRIQRSMGGASSSHVFNGTIAALALVAAGEGVALVPSLAMRGRPLPDGVDLVDVPGLGTRRVVLHTSLASRTANHPLEVATALVREASARVAEDL